MTVDLYCIWGAKMRNGLKGTRENSKILGSKGSVIASAIGIIESILTKIAKISTKFE
jgi:hypothetical protein